MEQKKIALQVSPKMGEIKVYTQLDNYLAKFSTNPPTPQTAKDAIDFENPPLMGIARVKGVAFLEILLVNRIADFALFFNVGKNMSEEQVKATAKAISSDSTFSILRLEEIEYCLNAIKFGKRGKIYDRIDGALILQELNRYFEEDRPAEIERINRELKDKTDSGEVNLIEVIIKGGFKPKVSEKDPIFNKPNSGRKSEQDIIINGFLKDFDLLFIEQNKESTIDDARSPIRLVNYKGVKCDVSTYLNKRIEEHVIGNK